MSLREFSWAMGQTIPALEKMVLLTLADHARENFAEIPFSRLLVKAGVNAEEAWDAFEALTGFGLIDILPHEGVPEGDFYIEAALLIQGGEDATVPQERKNLLPIIKEGVGFVYVIRLSETICKIGISTDVERRLKELQRGSGARLTIFQVFSVGENKMRKIERAALDNFANQRISGEWFCMAPIDAVAFIENYIRVSV